MSSNQNRHYINMDIMMNKIVRVLEVLVAERDHVHDLTIYEPSSSINERLDNLFAIVNTIESDNSNGMDDMDDNTSNTLPTQGTVPESNTVLPL